MILIVGWLIVIAFIVVSAWSHIRKNAEDYIDEEILNKHHKRDLARKKQHLRRVK